MRYKVRQGHTTTAIAVANNIQPHLICTLEPLTTNEICQLLNPLSRGPVNKDFPNKTTEFHKEVFAAVICIRHGISLYSYLKRTF